MALEDIFRALEEQASQECEDILEAARLQAEAIAADAEDRASRACAACVDEADSVLKRRLARETNAARLEAKKRVAAVKQRAIDEAFERAGVALAEARRSEGYPDVFRALIAEALEGVEGVPTVLIDPADEELARAVLETLGISTVVEATATTSGGVAVVTGNGRIVRRNTFEDRLEKARPDIESQVAEILFS
ncbi:MAG: V-type ATP synthase subunit E [Clostridiales bacterium]|nr:V-type ATP synthase subunit E [Clostridiales bacterium]